ncbi:MAG TPA: RNA polymerase sigma factor [Acidimicrobiales bacterium]|nr:RNA polymerase sigma factor [Acidimicrobiales bacterium]
MISEAAEEAPEAGEDNEAPRTEEESAQGFDDAFERLFLRAYRASFQILRSREDAEDVAMDTMACALRQWDRLDPRPDGWVVTVAVHRAIDQWRRAQRRRRHDDAARFGEPGSRGEDGFALRQALVKLPKRQRQVVAMRYFLDLSEQEIASALGCSTGSVKQHASRGLAALRRELADGELGEIADA